MAGFRDRGVAHLGVADGAEEDRVVGAESVHRSRSHHRARLAEAFGAEVEPFGVEVDAAGVRNGVEDAGRDADDGRPDAVAGRERDGEGHAGGTAVWVLSFLRESRRLRRA